MRLFEFGKGEAITSSKQFPVLYHLCDYIGFAYALEQDALRSRGTYLSTTWDEKMNHVEGRPFALFKFVVDGSVIDHYGAFHYDDSAIEIGVGGKRLGQVSHNEREIGIATTEVTPFSHYHHGTVLMFDLFSESGLQWLLYRNRGNRDGFGEKNSPTKQAIHAIHDHLFVLKKPLWKDKVGNLLTVEEMKLLKEVRRVSLLDLPFTKALEELADKLPIVDHQRKPVDRRTLVRRHMAPKLVELLNSYFADRLVRDVDVSKVRMIIEKAMKMLGLGNNAEAIIMHKIDTSGILHPTTPAVGWGSVITAMMDADIEEVCNTIDYVVDMERGRKEWWDSSDDGSVMWRHAVHSGTRFGRGTHQ